MTQALSNSDDYIDIRDVITEVETGELREELAELLTELAGCGGEHEWNGTWYPIGLIRDSYFEDYARELADDIGAIDSDMTWPNNCINWKQATQKLQMDYSAVEFDGITYWYR